MCPNCNSELKSTFFSNNQLLSQEVTEFIHAFTSSRAPQYCEKCGKPLIEQARQQARAQDAKLGAILNKYIHYVPLLSIQAPPAWSFTPLGLVTGQSVTGTGVFAEFASSWTDFFGAQSNAYNQKIAGGEIICQTQLRLKCIELGGNAILGTDIDYAEVGGLKGMLMVCMTGTAVLLENTEIIGKEALEGLNMVTQTARNRRAMRLYAGLINNPSHLILASSQQDARPAQAVDSPKAEPAPMTVPVSIQIAQLRQRHQRGELTAMELEQQMAKLTSKQP